MIKSSSIRVHPRRLGALVLICMLALCAGVAGAATQMIPASFAQLAEAVSPAVVNISAVRIVQDRNIFTFPNPGAPGGQGDPFDFFERFFGHQGPPRERKQGSLGSGFIVDREGYIITNNHVVENASEIMVKLDSGKEYQAEIVGRDPKTDLALLKIEADEELPSVRLGDSDGLKVGDWVVAIGNPFGLDHTVTAGIISAKGRVIGAGPYDDFLQTDASINPGNSGGPLLNLEGDVIGINTAISAVGQGIGFAIPSRLAQHIIGQLKSSGKVTRAWLGVVIQAITPELAASFDLPDQKGALVAEISPDSPAQKAGIKRGDVIVAFNGTPIDEMGELPPLVANTPVGSTAEVTVLRDGKKKTIRLRLAELPEEQAASAAQGERSDLLGLEVEKLTPETAERFRLDASGQGVVVVQVVPGSPAFEAGIRPGDVILEFNKKEIKTLADYQAENEKVQPGQTVLLLVKSGGRTLFRSFEIPK